MDFDYYSALQRCQQDVYPKTCKRAVISVPNNWLLEIFGFYFWSVDRDDLNPCPEGA